MVYVVVIDVLRCRHAYFAPSLSPENQRLTLWLFKRGPFASQKESFWSVKGVLLACKTSPFGVQKDYIFQSGKIQLVFSHNYITKIQKNVRFRSFNEHFARAE